MSDETEEILKKIEEYRRIISGILEAFQNVPFHIIIEVATDKKVEPFDLNNDNDKLLINELKHLANITMNYFYNNPIPIKRINEVSNFLEEQVSFMFRNNKSQFKVIQDVKHLGGSGYPDLLILDKFGRYIYVDIKATQRPDKGSPRDFYITPLKETRRKVTQNGKHCVLGFVIQGSPENFRTVAWKLVDLYNVKLNMKPEFNCDNRELYRREYILAENHI